MPEFSPHDMSDEEAVHELLDVAFPNADIPDEPIYDRAVERLLTDHIPSPTGSSMESVIEQERLRRQLFGNSYQAEYRPRLRHPNRKR